MRPSDQDILDHAASMLPTGRPMLKAEPPRDEPPARTRSRTTLKALAERGRSILKGIRTVAVGATIRHYSNGRLGTVIAYVRRVTQDEYDAKVAAAIQRGVESLVKVLRRSPPAIPDAFHNPRLGPIGLDFVGAKHIVDQRIKQYGDIPEDATDDLIAQVLLDVARTAILGNPQEDLRELRSKGKPEAGRWPSRITLVHGIHEVIVEPNWKTDYPEYASTQTTWIVSGYRMDESRIARRHAEQETMKVKFQYEEPPKRKGQKK